VRERETAAVVTRYSHGVNTAARARAQSLSPSLFLSHALFLLRLSTRITTRTNTYQTTHTSTHQNTLTRTHQNTHTNTHQSTHTNTHQSTHTDPHQNTPPNTPPNTHTCTLSQPLCLYFHIARACAKARSDKLFWRALTNSQLLCLYRARCISCIS